MAIVKQGELKQKINEINFNILIAGVPGIGKTTLGLSAPKPLLIDLDKGLWRVNPQFHKDASQVETYEELLKDLKETDLSIYETIVIDTGERLFDLMKGWAGQLDAKKYIQADGSLTLKGYGLLGKEFMQFVNDIKFKFHKHCVVLFHSKEEKENDFTKLRILIEGQSKDNVWQPMDLGGFMEIIKDKRTIGFANNERYFAKGSFGITGVLEIDNNNETGKNDFLTRVIEKATQYIEDNFSKTEETNEAYQKIMAEYLPQIEVATEENINQLTDEISKANHITTSKKELSSKLADKAKSLGLKRDKEKNLWIKE